MPVDYTDIPKRFVPSSSTQKKLERRPDLMDRWLAWLEEYKENREMISDHQVGWATADTSDTYSSQEREWAYKLYDEYRELARTNAYYFYNQPDTKQNAQKRTLSKVISKKGFASSIRITHAYPPPLAFTYFEGDRDVKHIVLHSFGQMFDLNQFYKGLGALQQVRLSGGDVVYVPRGNDPIRGMYNQRRISAGLSAIMTSGSIYGAHFYIDRVGNLFIIGDCNLKIEGSHGLSRTGVAIEIEEALYIRPSSSGSIPKKPKISGGDGVHFFDYTKGQMHTLSVLLKKLELAYPRLLETSSSSGYRTVTSNRGISRSTSLGMARNKGRGFDDDEMYRYAPQKLMKASSPPCYTMHDHIVRGKHFDVSPHLNTEEEWKTLFNMMDSHSGLTVNDVWNDSISAYSENYAGVKATQNGSKSAFGHTMGSKNRAFGKGMARASAMVNAGRSSYHTGAAAASSYAAGRAAQTQATQRNIGILEDKDLDLSSNTNLLEKNGDTLASYSDTKGVLI